MEINSVFVNTNPCFDYIALYYYVQNISFTSEVDPRFFLFLGKLESHCSYRIALIKQMRVSEQVKKDLMIVIL